MILYVLAAVAYFSLGIGFSAGIFQKLGPPTRSSVVNIILAIIVCAIWPFWIMAEIGSRISNL